MHRYFNIGALQSCRTLTIRPRALGTADSLTAQAEAVWGADPLEYSGGFRNLSYDATVAFRSSLPTSGTASWSTTSAVQTSVSSTSATAALSITFSNVDWEFLKVVYGWAAAQYQGWARGELRVTGETAQHVVLHTDGVLEYWVDDEHYFGGDFYSFRKASPVLHLTPGVHQIDLRLVRDVRAFGGIAEPTINVVVEVQQVSGSLELSKPGILMSDVIDGRLATPIASISLRNSGEEDIEIVEIRPSDVSSSTSTALLDLSPELSATEDISSSTSEQMSDSFSKGRHSSRLIIVAGQTRPVTFEISLPTHKTSSVDFTIVYKHLGGSQFLTLQVHHLLHHVSSYQPHKITFRHPAGMTSYAMLRPPAKNASCNSQGQKLPVLLALHGAGLEADNPMVTSALDLVSDLCAWVLFPTGVTPWSSDDWHNWGFTDVEAAIHAIPGWIEYVGWQGPDVDIDRWIVTGHSNGGQGTWYALTHHPDKVLAAAPVSGYASIQKYVSYELWQPADPRKTAIISSSLNSYRHEMLMSNAYGIPLQQQHGEIDDNVPAYHSRFLSQQLHLAGSASKYAEITGRNHYWDGVMTTPELVDFYYEQAKNLDILPRKPEQFSMLVGDPGDTGSKGGITVTSLKDPGHYGRVDVTGHIIRTRNVLSLDFNPRLWNRTVLLNGQAVALTQSSLPFGSPVRVYKMNGTWSTTAPSREVQRHRRQMGSMAAILRTNGPFVIRHRGSINTSHVALQISRSLHQYFQADTIIEGSRPYTASSRATGNCITLAINSSIENFQAGFPIRVNAPGVSIRDHLGYDQSYGEEARGAAFLRPLEDEERLDLVLWGADLDGLKQASRMVPTLTGVGQPDFVVFGKSAKWKGIEGVLAMGFFDSNWEVTASSMVESE